jgi:Enolase C-terminal domain-like
MITPDTLKSAPLWIWPLQQVSTNTRWQFHDLIERAKVDILQPDLVKCAGLSEGIRIAHLAGTHAKFLVPHQNAADYRHDLQRAFRRLL